MNSLQFFEFLDNRLFELKRSRRQLVAEIGYANIDKGLRQLASLEADGVRALSLVPKLAAAFNVPIKVLTDLIAADKSAQREAEAREFARTFQAHAVVLCERSIPEPIFLAAMTGSAKARRIDFEPHSLFPSPGA